MIEFDLASFFCGILAAFVLSSVFALIMARGFFK
jgi:hypothetical protein